MKRSWALDRLLTRARFRTPWDDAELRAAGVAVDDDVQAAVLRGLAACGQQTHAELVQWCQLDPALDQVSLNRVKKALVALARRNTVVRTRGTARLNPELHGRFAHLDRLDAPAPLEPPTLDLKGLLAARPRRRSTAPSFSVAEALELLDAPFDHDQATALTQQTAERASLQALFDWFGAAVVAPSWRPALQHAMARLSAATIAATATPPHPVETFAATWINFLARHTHITPNRLNKEPDRREELARRWAWFAGARLQGETPRDSAAAIVRLDARRLDAERRDAALKARIATQQDTLIAAEKKRREEAAAYAAARRE